MKKSRSCRVLVFCVVMLMTSAPAQERTLAVRADRWLDVASGEVRSEALVVVEGDRITRVGGKCRPAPKSWTWVTSRCCRV